MLRPATTQLAAAEAVEYVRGRVVAVQKARVVIETPEGWGTYPFALHLRPLLSRLRGQGCEALFAMRDVTVAAVFVREIGSP